MEAKKTDFTIKGNLDKEQSITEDQFEVIKKYAKAIQEETGLKCSIEEFYVKGKLEAENGK